MVHALAWSLRISPGAWVASPVLVFVKCSEFFQWVILALSNFMNSNPLMCLSLLLTVETGTLQFKKAMKEMLLPSNFICSGIFPRRVVKS